MKLGQLIDIVTDIFYGNVLLEYWILNPGPFQFTNLRQSIENQ